jgi:hypothetical protein
LSRYFNTNSYIPSLLLNSNNWLCWKKGNTDSRGKFPKYPVNPIHSFKISYTEKNNLLSFDDAVSAYINNLSLSGIGFKLELKPIIDNKYLVGIDIDYCEGRGCDELDVFRQELEGTYSESSPSGKGMRLFALTTEPFSNWTNDHIEVYLQSRWLTITGLNQQGEIKDITESLKKFNAKHSKKSDTKVKLKAHRAYVFPTPNEIANIRYFLSCINADCIGHEYRNVVFSILSLGWGELGIELAKEWSKTAMHRWNESYFEDLLNRYDSDRTFDDKDHKNNKITIGTLLYQARETFKKIGSI